MPDRNGGQFFPDPVTWPNWSSEIECATVPIRALAFDEAVTGHESPEIINPLHDNLAAVIRSFDVGKPIQGRFNLFVSASCENLCPNRGNPGVEIVIGLSYSITGKTKDANGPGERSDRRRR